MSKAELIGQRFGRLTVIKEGGRAKSRSVIWICQCDCGNIHNVTTSLLIKGSIKSCGCLRREMVIQKNYKHGLSNTRLYHIWASIKDRCYRKSDKNYPSYGARGIKMCQEWQENFQSFYEWAMSSGYDELSERGECTIDRINNDGNYEPSNCRWANSTVQQRNKRNNHYITYKGETHPVTEWAEILGIGKGTLESRINDYGWPIEKALSTPVRKCNRTGANRFLTFNNKTQTVAEWARELNMEFNTLYSRIFNYHWSVEKAIKTPVKNQKEKIKKEGK